MYSWTNLLKLIITKRTILHLFNLILSFLYYCTFSSFIVFSLNHSGPYFTYAQNIYFPQTQNNTITGDIQNQIDIVIGSTWTKLMDETISTTTNSKTPDNNIYIDDNPVFLEQNHIANLLGENKPPNVINTEELLQTDNIPNENSNSIPNLTSEFNPPSTTSDTVINLTGFNIDEAKSLEINNTNKISRSDAEDNDENNSLPFSTNYNNYEKNSFWNPFSDLSNYLANIFNNPCR